MNNKQNPFDIPELRILIGRHLSLDERKACALVCKAWCQDMQPLVWETFYIRGVSISNSRYLRDDDHVLSGSFGVRSLARRKELQMKEEERFLSLEKNAHLIRYLEHVYDEEREVWIPELMTVLTCHCRSLISFVAWLTTLDEVHWQQCKRLIQRNPNLQKIELRSSSSDKSAITDFLLDFPFVQNPFGGRGDEARWTQLRRLTIGCNTSISVLARILDACPALQEITVAGDVLPVSPKYLDATVEEGDHSHHAPGGKRAENAIKEPSWGDLRQSELKMLELERLCSDLDLAAFLMLCPKLDTMVLTDIHADVGMPVCKVIEDGRLSNLTSLMLGSGHYNPGLHRAVLEALPPHQIKNLHLQDIDADDIQLLVKRQHQSLEDMHLDLNYHTLANSPPDHHIGQYAAILDILSSCARLRELTIEPGGNRVVDIRHLIAKPWVCTKMEALEIPLALSRSAINNVLSQLPDDEKKEAAIRQIAQDDDHNRPLEEEVEEGGEDVGKVDVQEQRQEWEQCEVVFMKRLGELHKLRELNLQGIYDPLSGVAPSFESLTWTLANGLGYLKNLKSLEYLDLGTGPYYQGVQEFEWMKQHWPNLRDFHFSYTESVEVFDWIHKHWPELRFEETKPNIEDWYDEE